MNLSPEVAARVLSVISLVAARSAVSGEEVRTSRYKAASRARQLAMHILHRDCGLSRRSIARGFGRRGRTCVDYALFKIAQALTQDATLDRFYRTLVKELPPHDLSARPRPSRPRPPVA